MMKMEILGKNFWNVIFHLELLLSAVRGHKTLKVGVVSKDHDLINFQVTRNLPGSYRDLNFHLLNTEYGWPCLNGDEQEILSKLSTPCLE